MKDSLGKPDQLVMAFVTQELDYLLSASAFQLLNQGQDGGKNRLLLFQSLKYRCLVKKDSIFSWLSTINHDLGIQVFFDSILQIHPDETTFSTRITLNLHKALNGTFSSDLTTGLLNNYVYIVDDHGRRVKVLGSSFMTPMTLTFSLGIGHSWPGLGDLNLGLSSGKFIYLLDKNIFDELRIQDYCGIPKGKNHRFEYGLSMQFLADKDLFKNLHWNCDMLLFKKYSSPLDISFKNIFSLKLMKFLKASIQTKILYEEDVCKNLRIENLVNIGFSVNL